jgi:hypothetical protein
MKKKIYSEILIDFDVLTPSPEYEKVFHMPSVCQSLYVGVSLASAWTIQRILLIFRI